MMRIGVVAPRQPSTIGGGFTFHTTVLKTLENVTSEHEFIILDIAGIGAHESMNTNLQRVDATSFHPDKEQSVQTEPTARFAAVALNLDLVWYLDPLAEVLPVPVFATVLDLAHRQHPFFPEVSSRGWKWESRENHYQQVLPRAARIFTGTPTGKEQVSRYYGVNLANIVINPFPTTIFPESDPPVADDSILLKHALSAGFLFYPAQFWPHKNHVNLLLAIKYLEDEHGLTPDLVLTGSDAGNLEHVKRVAAELDLQQRVHFLGFVPGDEMSALYRSASALVFPSLFGPDNLPPLEAFSLGCPVLTGRIEGVEEQLGKNSALFFDPTNPVEIADAIRKNMRNPLRRANMIKKGRKLALKRSPKAYVQTVLQTLDNFEPWHRNWPGWKGKQE